MVEDILFFENNPGILELKSLTLPLEIPGKTKLHP